MEVPLSKRLPLIALMLAVAAPCTAQTGASFRPDSAAATPPPLMVVAPTPPDFPRGRISGYMFGDYYYNVVGDPNHVYDASGADLGKTSIDNSSKPVTQDLNGTQLRRVYFQLDNDLSIRYATRLRLEIDSKSLTSDGKLGANVKAAYFQAKSVIPRGDFFFGMMSTPIWDNAEEFWQYRSIEKTIGDFRGIGSAADIGVELKGFADGDHHFGYALMIGDGLGQKPETDRYKKYYLALPVRFGDLRLEPYVDYENVRLNLKDAVAPLDSVPGIYDRATYKLFAGYEFRRVAVGAEGLVRLNHWPTGPNREPAGYSVFTRGTLTSTVAGFARFDFWSPDRNLKNRIDSQLWIAGVDWQPFKDIHIMPNIEATQYVRKGKPSGFPAHHDLQARVTFYYKFSRPQS
jgi:hypothetical protein